MKSMRNLDELDQTVDLSITLVLRIDYGTARSTDRARERCFRVYVVEEAPRFTLAPMTW